MYFLKNRFIETDSIDSLPVPVPISVFKTMTTLPLHTWNHHITPCTYHKQKLLNIDMPRKKQYHPKKKEILKMQRTTEKLLPNIAQLKLNTAKNSKFLHANESSLIRLAFLQGPNNRLTNDMQALKTKLLKIAMS
jgi:hypothetical protein